MITFLNKKLETLLCSIGHNHPVSGTTVINLLLKLTATNRYAVYVFIPTFVSYFVVSINCLLQIANYYGLYRFQELSINGIKLSKPVVDSLCQLAKDCCMSGLLLGNTNIGTVSYSSILLVRLLEGQPFNSSFYKARFFICLVTMTCVFAFDSNKRLKNHLVYLIA